MPEVSEVKAIDPSLFFINKANEVLKQHLCGPVQQEGGKEGGAAAAAAAGAGAGGGAGGGGGCVHSVVEEDEDGAPLLGPREARKLDFGVGDGRDLGAWPAGRFDAVVLHTTLIHVPNHDIPSVLSEAYRVLAPGGVLSVFENDPAGWNVRHSEYDPLDLALKIMVSRGGRDVNLCQQLPSLLLAAGFQDTATLRKHAVVNTADDSYGMTVIARGIRMLCDQGHVSPALAAALQAEASVRAAGGRFNLSMSYAHCLGTKPPSGPGAPFAASAARTFAAQEAAAAAAAQDAAAAAAAAAVQDVAAQEAGARLAAEAEEAAAAAAERAAAAEAARAAARAEAAEAAAAQAARAAARAAEKAREGAAAALLPAAPAVATRGGGKESESTGSANSFTARDDPKQKGRRTRSGDSQKLAAKKKDTKKTGGDDDVPSEV